VGIDPHTVEMLSSLLERSHDSRETRIILALAGDEHFPNWITNLAYILHDYRVHSIGSVDEVVESIAKNVNAIRGKSLQDVTEEDAAYIQEAGRIYESRKDPLAREGTYNPNRILWKALEGRRYRAMWDYIRGFRARLPTGPKEGEPKPVPRRHWLSRDDFPTYDTEKFTPGEPIVEMEGVKVTYGNDVILGGWGQRGNETPKEGLWWTIRRGERWGVFGPNGSGKTTLTALMMSDHPQSYSLPIKIFGKSRLPSPGQPGVSIFDLQSNIGISSPELHALFPKHLTARRVLESAWAETPLAAVTQLTAEIDQKVSSALRWFQGEICPELGDSPLYRRELLRAHGSPKPGSPRMSQIESQHMVHAFDPTYLEWADYRTFGSLPFASQRLLLFLRAIIKQPDLIVLDEAFSGMDANTVHKCHLFLSHGEGRILRLHSATHVRLRQRGLPSDLAKMGLVQIPGLSARQALVFISHRQEEVPGCIREWICLPEPGSTSDGRPAAPRFGRLGGPLEASDTRWRDIWGLPQRNVRRYRSTGCYARGAGLATEALAAAARERRAREPPEKRERRRRVERAVYRALDTRKKEARMLRDLMRVYVTPWDRAARLMGRVEYTLATAVAVMGKVEERRRAGAQQNGENSVLSGSI
jgi:ABC-type molybdenum transport system ATPase subunit/photorepair protein PhrA